MRQLKLIREVGKWVRGKEEEPPFVISALIGGRYQLPDDDPREKFKGLLGLYVVRKNDGNDILVVFWKDEKYYRASGPELLKTIDVRSMQVGVIASKSLLPTGRLSKVKQNVVWINFARFYTVFVSLLALAAILETAKHHHAWLLGDPRIVSTGQEEPQNALLDQPISRKVTFTNVGESSAQIRIQHVRKDDGLELTSGEEELPIIEPGKSFDMSVTAVGKAPGMLAIEYTGEISNLGLVTNKKWEGLRLKFHIWPPTRLSKEKMDVSSDRKHCTVQFLLTVGIDAKDEVRCDVNIPELTLGDLTGDQINPGEITYSNSDRSDPPDKVVNGISWVSRVERFSTTRCSLQVESSQPLGGKDWERMISMMKFGAIPNVKL